MRISQVTHNLSIARKLLTSEERKMIRKTAKILRDPTVGSVNKFSTLDNTPLSSNVSDYFWEMKVIGKRGWNYVADRLENTLGYAKPRSSFRKAA